MSLDGGYTNSIDHAIANLHVGRHQGREQGYQDGLNDGFDNGWNAAVKEANAEMRKQLEITSEYIAEKDRLKAEVIQQREMINQLVERVRELEEENANILKSDSDLFELTKALKGANQRLQAQIADLDEKYQEKSREHSEQLWQYNRCLVFMHSVRQVIEDLTSENTAHSERVRELFNEKYKDQVAKAIDKEALLIPLEEDDEFAKRLPKTKQFILEMLNSVGNKHDSQLGNHDRSEEWVP